MKIQKKLAVLFTAIAMIFLLIPTGVKATLQITSIHFDVNCGVNEVGCNGGMNDQQLTFQTTENLIANGFTREGYQFNGWSTKSGVKVADQANIYNNIWGKVANDDVVDGTLTLYAQWKADTAPTPATAPAPKATAVSSGWIPSFEIQFLDCNGKVISDQWVGDGQPAAIPDGYTYGEEELNWVYRNLTVSPIGCKVSGFVVPDTADKN